MTQLEIHREALTHNVTTLTSKLAPGVRFIAVVKANAYGHGAVACVQHLQSLGVKHFAVAYTDEGIALRQAGVQDPIMVFYPEPTDLQILLPINCLPPFTANKPGTMYWNTSSPKRPLFPFI